MHKKQSKKHKKSKVPRDHAAVALNSLTPVITNEERPDEEVRKSYDEVKQDQSDRKTDTMGEIDKEHEDGFY